MNKPVILILCTGNSCRSHMAEGFLRHFAGVRVQVESAGCQPAGYVHPLAVEVMAEAGIDISGHRSKHLNEFAEGPVHTVITVCDHANELCPVFPGQMERFHWPFADPAKAAGTQGEIRRAFRTVRDQIGGAFERFAEKIARVMRCASGAPVPPPPSLGKPAADLRGFPFTCIFHTLSSRGVAAHRSRNGIRNAG